MRQLFLASGMDSQPWLGSPALLAPLHFLILPRLAVKDLVYLSCACRDLRAALACAPPNSWLEAASAALPQPILSSQWSEALVLLSRYAQAKHNISQDGLHSTSLLAHEQQLPGRCTPTFSPDGALLCVTTFWPIPGVSELLGPFGTTVTVQQVHTGLAFRLRVRGRPRSCIFTHDAQQLIFAAAELENTALVGDAAAVSSPAKAICVSWQILTVTGDGLQLLSLGQCCLTADPGTWSYLPASFAPGGRFLAVASYSEEYLPKVLFIVDIKMGQLAYAPISEYRTFAWHAEGCKLATVNNDGALHTFNLVSGQQQRRVVGEDLWGVSWRGDMLLSIDVWGTTTIFSDPFSVSSSCLQLYSLVSASISPCGEVGVHIADGDIALPVVRVLKTGQQLCTLACGPTKRYKFHRQCIWSQDAQFLACTADDDVWSPTYTFHDTASGATLLPKLQHKVIELQWAPDCCSVALLIAGSKPWAKQVLLVRFVPGAQLQSPQWCGAGLRPELRGPSVPKPPIGCAPDSVGTGVFKYAILLGMMVVGPFVVYWICFSLYTV